MPIITYNDTVTLTEPIAREMLAQIGALTVLAVSGGRWSLEGDRLVLPCGSGYEVHVQLDPMDWYRVSRVKKGGGLLGLMDRGALDLDRVDVWHTVASWSGEPFELGSLDMVWCDNLHEAVYRAGMFEDAWPEGGITMTP